MPPSVGGSVFEATSPHGRPCTKDIGYDGLRFGKPEGVQVNQELLLYLVAQEIRTWF
jgi:hypothetical protein